jgi:predicted DNA-binding transcriptional regulator AlpA
MQQIDVIPRSRLCDELGVSRSTIKRWIETRHFPKPLKASGPEPLFYASQVRDWFAYIEAQND